MDRAARKSARTVLGNVLHEAVTSATHDGDDVPRLETYGNKYMVSIPNESSRRSTLTGRHGIDITREGAGVSELWHRADVDAEYLHGLEIQ